MTDGVKKIGDAKMADAVVKAYAEGFGGITDEECAAIGLDNDHCKLLQESVQSVYIEDGWDFGSNKGSIFWYSEWVITSNFSDEFIEAFANGDRSKNGKRPHRARMRWLLKNCTASEVTDVERMRMIEELRSLPLLLIAEAPAVPYLVEALNYKVIRLKAIHILRDLGPKAKAAIPKLSELIRTDGKDPVISQTAIEALAFIGLPSDKTLQRIFKYLKVRFAHKTKLIAEYDPRLGLYMPGCIARFGGPIIPYLKDIIKRGRMDDYSYLALLIIKDIELEKEGDLSDFIPEITNILKNNVNITNHFIIFAAMGALAHVAAQERKETLRIAEFLIDCFFENYASKGYNPDIEHWKGGFLRDILPELLTPQTASDLIMSKLNASKGDEWQDKKSRIGFAIQSLQEVFAHLKRNQDGDVPLQTVIDRLEASPDRFKGAWLGVISRMLKNTIPNEISKRFKDALPAVLDTFNNSSDPFTRLAAMDVIRDIGIWNQGVINAIMAGLEDNDMDVNYVAVKALSELVYQHSATIMPEVEGLMHYALPLLTAVRNKYKKGTNGYLITGELIKEMESRIL